MNLLKNVAVTLCVAATLTAVAQQEPPQVELVPWVNNLATALDVVNCGDDRLFVVRQYGAINIAMDSMQWLPTPFLDISTVVLYGGERGLLGMTFDPDYASNGHFYVNYTFNDGAFGTTRISRFTVSSDPNIADPASEVIMITLPQPDPIHQAGSLLFGNDGYLYVAFGDGGGASDPSDWAQNRTNIYGTIIRVDVQPDGTYLIPPDNPFVGNVSGWREEIWAWGLRNPYRIALDPANDDLWIGDVGQALWEEISYWPGGDNSGPNFGWRCYEGNNVFNPAGCGEPSNYVFPLIDHAHSVNGGNFCAIVGGKVYRGTEYPRLDGIYFYTDFCSGELRYIKPDGAGDWLFGNALTSALVGNTAIGYDRHGEMYLVNLFNGIIYKIKDKCPMPSPVITQDASDLVSTPAPGYQWFYQGTVVEGATSQVFEPVFSGSYTVQGIFGNGCAFMSEPFIYIGTSVDHIDTATFRMYPNPATDRVVLERLVGSDGILTLTLSDLRGRQVLSEVVPTGNTRHEFGVAHLAEGPYAVEIRDVSGRPIHRSLLAVTR